MKNILKLTDDKTDDLPGLLPLVPNMPILLTENICTQLGLTNGTTGIFRSLIYEPEEDEISSEMNDDLIFPTDTTIFIRKPLCAIIEIESSKIDGIFDDLEPKMIPIPLSQGYFTISSKEIFPDSLRNLMQNPFNVTIKRTQFPFVPGNVITTYKAQGQTIPKVIIDLVLPPYVSKFEIAAAYVPLSRVKSLEDILILRNFKFESISMKPTLHQKLELNRFEMLNCKTRNIFDKLH